MADGDREVPLRQVYDWDREAVESLERSRARRRQRPARWRARWRRLAIAAAVLTIAAAVALAGWQAWEWVQVR